MSRLASKFSQRDVTRFVLGLAKAKLKPARIEILADGRLSAVIDPASSDDDDNSELAELRRRHGQ